MADPPQRSIAGSSHIEFECCQLTLDDWAEALQATCRPRQSPIDGSVAATTAASNGKEPPSRAESGGATASHRPSPTELLETPDALLTRTHLRDLGLERRAVDAVFRTLAVVFLPGYARPMIRAQDYLALLEHCTYRDDRVRRCA
jgi:hypothetical protein